MDGDDTGNDESELANDESLGSHETQEPEEDGDDGEDLQPNQHQDGEDLLLQFTSSCVNNNKIRTVDVTISSTNL